MGDGGWEREVCTETMDAQLKLKGLRVVGVVGVGIWGDSYLGYLGYLWWGYLS